MLLLNDLIVLSLGKLLRLILMRPFITNLFAVPLPTHFHPPPPPKTFLELLERKNIVPFSSEIHDFPIMQQ